MKKQIFLLIILTSSLLLLADSPFYKKTDWLGKDKIMHFSGSAFLTVWNYGLFHDCFSNSKDNSVLISFSITSFMGVSKEYSDLKLKGSGWSWQDLVYDLAGIGFGLIMINNFEIP